MEEYFQELNRALKNYKRAIPLLILDLDRLDHNIEVLKQSLRPGMDFRIVVKSLPSPELLRYLMGKTGSRQLMVFHQPFLSDLSRRLDAGTDLLLGKPMPVRTAAFYYETVAPLHGFDPLDQIQWLIDTEQRLKEYSTLARQLGQRLRVNLEIDVGLHRGGFPTEASLAAALEFIRDHPEQLRFSGLMGYDPHVVKLPRLLRTPERAFTLANTFYQQCVALIRERFPQLWHDGLTFNGAGSPTLALHGAESSVLGEIAAGSCLVKPTTFDIPSLKDFLPACFIATPVLKKMEGTVLPGIEKFSKMLGGLLPAWRRAFFIYGGYWRADYVYPLGARENQLFGSSTNQSMINVPPGPALEVDDFVFLRPHQSEFVFLQFGKLLLWRKGGIQGEWDILQQ